MESKARDHTPLGGDTVETSGQADRTPESEQERQQVHPNVRLWLRLVGEFEAVGRNGVSAAPISKKARALLALVAAHTPQPIRRDFAASLLWSGKPRDHAANSLRQALRELQIALSICGDPPILMAGGGRLSLQADRVWIDIHDPTAIRWKSANEGAVGPLLLCQNLQGLDPAFDAHLERLWKNLVFQQAFAPQGDEDQIQFAPAPSNMFDEAELPPPSENRPSPAPLAARNEDGAHAHGWRIAVLPFRSLGSPLEGGLSLGMAEEVSAALARFRMPRLIATGSFWDGSGPSADALTRCRAYNLDYVISGTIQTSGTRVRVTVTLLDVSMDFEVIWASRFEGTTADLFSLQDTIASQTVAQIDPELLQRHQFTSDVVQAPAAAAHHAVMAAIQGIYRPDRDRFMQANDFLSKAIALDSNYAAAYAWQAYWYIIGVSQGWIGSPAEAVEKAGIAAEKAIELDPLDARGLAIAGHVKAYILHDVEASLALQQRALSLNPNLPIAWSLSSWAHIYSGDHKTAIEHALMAESLSPTDPHVFFMEHAAMTARFFLKELETADSIAISALERRPRHATALRIRLAILGHLGRLDDARACIESLKALNQTISVKSIILPPLQPKDREYYAEGLRLAGVRD